MQIKRFSLKHMREEAAADAATEEEKTVRSLPEMIDDVIRNYHRTELSQMDDIEVLLRQALFADYAKNEYQLLYIHSKFAEFRASLEQHFAKEEAIVFPLMLDETRRNRASWVKVMELENEHSQAEEKIWDLRQNTSYFSIPGDSCAAMQDAYRKLAVLCDGISDHIAEENGVIFPAYEKLIE